MRDAAYRRKQDRKHKLKERADKKLKKELLAEATTEIDTNDWCDGCYDDCNTCAFKPLN